MFAQSGRVRVIVRDTARATIARAEVTLIGPDDKPIRTQVSDEQGVSRWADLPMGEIRLRANMPPYFKARQVTATIKNGDEVPVEIVLDVSETMVPPVGDPGLLPAAGR